MINSLSLPLSPQGKEPCIEGTSWRHECNLCHCSNGFTRCTKIACAKPGCHGESCVDRPLPALCHLPPMTGSLKCMAFMPKWSFSNFVHQSPVASLPLAIPPGSPVLNLAL
ncbi:hypothetical protein GWK47_016989 [Chionoecetes opilio]|uniref:Pacifastin domain-containing protein n=1 Tax=Chionoecetes opilio TaxID=41210 RepID=A0A8J4XSY3_CHIOP|nr:hypothetical protein GWK47_016989 [Chionoecetes opilio]